MSVLGEYPEAINNKKDLQIWNNSAFDDGGDSESFNSYNQIKSPSWSTKKPVTVNLSSDSLNSSFSSKENQSPSGFSKPSVIRHPIQKSKPFSNHPIKIGSNVLENIEKTDEEIEIENEISRLYAKLESIRSAKNAKYVEKQEKSVLIDSDKKKESRNKIQRRGFSLGPNEIMSATTLKSKQSGTTPVQSTVNRRKSCFWKLDDIEEEKSRGIKNPSIRHAVTTVGSKKGMKKDDSVLTSIQPKKLFGEQSVPAKKPIKPGRVIPSRYNQATVTSLMKKRDNVERRSRGGTEGRVKKKWDLSNVVVIPNRLNLDDNKDENENENEDENTVDVVMQDVLLPKIRVVRCVEESGRDSGRAKRVAELVNKKSYFDEEALCQKLSFEED